MISVRLDPDAERRIARLAKQQGRTKAAYAREALLEHLEDCADAALAERRIATLAKTYSAAEVKRALDI